MRILKELRNAEFEYEFLKTEWYKSFYNPVRNKLDKQIKNPQLDDPEYNELVHSLLWKQRGPLLSRLLNNIKWQEAKITIEDFENMLIIREIGWEKTFGQNKKLAMVASAVIDGVNDNFGVDVPKIRSIQQNIGKHDFAEKLILISRSINELPTIIEGNHRALAFQLEKIEKSSTAHIPTNIILGTSPIMNQCIWWNWV